MKTNLSIAGIRKEYMLESLLEKDVKANPMQQFSVWWDEAIKSEIDEVNAMTLATVGSSGKPTARIVLLKGYTDEGFVFFTNYLSHKGGEMDENPHVALVFFWKELERQIRIEGTVEKISEEDSDTYFNSRPQGSKIGSWASPQSTPIAGRHIIEENVQKYTEKFSTERLTRPPHWGGYMVTPVKIEFWQGRSSRLHDRIQYSLLGNEWNIERLAP